MKRADFAHLHFAKAHEKLGDSKVAPMLTWQAIGGPFKMLTLALALAMPVVFIEAAHQWRYHFKSLIDQGDRAVAVWRWHSSSIAGGIASTNRPYRRQALTPRKPMRCEMTVRVRRNSRAHFILPRKCPVAHALTGFEERE